jgi:hypothetical protein
MVDVETPPCPFRRQGHGRWGRENPLQHVVRAVDLTKLSGPELDALERFADARLAAFEVAADSKGSNEQS